MLERTAGDLPLRGTAPAAARALRLVVDGDLAQAQTVHPDTQGRWQATVDTSRMVDARVMHEAVLWDAETGAVSPTARFRVERAWQLLADVDDPAGDDAGPQGRYRYPTDASYGAQRTMDLRRVQAWGAGGALRLDLTMAGLSSSWNPPNGFDHLALTVYIELPGRDDGSAVMPLQNATLPPGMRWHRRLRVHGWSNALFTSEGADASNEGTPAAAAATPERELMLASPAAKATPAAAKSRRRLWGTEASKTRETEKIKPMANGIIKPRVLV